MPRSRLSARQRSYETDLINRLSDNHRMHQARGRLADLGDRDRRTVYDRLSGRTQERLRQRHST